MTAPEIVTALQGGKGPTPERLLKAQGQAKRSGVPWADVVDLLQRAQEAKDRDAEATRSETEA